MAIPLFTESTNRVNVSCSTFTILLLYCLFFSFSCPMKTFSDVKWRWDSEFGFLILTSKKAFCPSRQNPLARTSGFALTPVRTLMISYSSGCNGGSLSASLQISVSDWASKSYFIVMNCNKFPGFAVEVLSNQMNSF